jgi:hypothetical protein
VLGPTSTIRSLRPIQRRPRKELNPKRSRYPNRWADSAGPTPLSGPSWGDCQAHRFVSSGLFKSPSPSSSAPRFAQPIQIDWNPSPKRKLMP